MALQDILQKITSDTNKKAAFMKQVVDDEIKKIEEEAKDKAELRKEEIEEKIKVQANSIIEKSKTLAHMESRSKLLFQKRELIDLSYEELINELVALNDTEYVKIISSMLKSLSNTVKKGSLIVPENRKKLMGELLKKLELDYHIKDSSSNMKGGFILHKGKIEYNYTFDYIIQKSIRVNTELEVAKILFS